LKLSYEIKTGVLVLTGIILFIIGFSYLKSNDVFIKDRVFYAVYEDVEGVSKGTPVTISGFNVGSVQDIKFFNNSSKLLLKFRVENDFNFSNQSTAQIYETGLIGGKALAVIPKYGNEIAKSGDTLNSSIAPGLTELVNDKLSPLQEKIESMVVSADSVLISLNSVLNTQAKDQIQSTITNFSSTVTDLKNSAGTLDEMISMNKNKINNIITNVNKSSNELSDLSNSFSDLTVIIENLSESSNSIENIVNEISSGNGSLGNLIYDDNLIKSLNAASSNINLLIEDLRLNPKRYVHFSLFGKKNKPYNKEEE
jgi:phospholipid/cholesterol/gamma-HCH transport system substrate-binding protein|tara:strand:+ start:1454 stop:2386 length:933 start_codon:yes stop_codon:yes gene_type:complete